MGSYTRTLRDLGIGKPKPAPRRLDLQYAIEGLRRGQNPIRPVAGRTSLRSFCRTYLGHHLYHAYGEHHEDLFTVLEEPSPVHGKRVCRAEPRKFGKTTIISLALPLWHLAYRTKKFILLVGESSSTAEANLASLVHELENNTRLLNAFPHLVPHRDSKNQITKWTDSSIMLQDGSMVVTKGMSSRMRGMKQQQYRPDLGIVDDPESPETVGSFLVRERHKRWFGGTFLGIGGDSWDVYVIGNLVHHDGLLASLLKSPEWNSKLFRAVNIPRREEERYPIGNTRTDESPLWPEVWPLERLDAYRREPTVGDLGFAREMMNDPREEKDKPFDVSQFTYVDFVPDQVPTYSLVCTFIDPAGGEKPNEMKRGKRDYAAIVTGGRTKDGFIDIFSVTLTRQPPDGQVDLLLQEYTTWGSRYLGVEENMYKNLLSSTIERVGRERGLYPAVDPKIQIHNKVQRILATQPLLKNGIVRFARHLRTQVPEYFGQWDDFPGDFDDGPDATEGLIRTIEGKAIFGIPSGVSSSSYWRPTNG